MEKNNGTYRFQNPRYQDEDLDQEKPPLHENQEKWLDKSDSNLSPPYPLLDEQGDQEEVEQRGPKNKKNKVDKQDNTFSIDGEDLEALRETLQAIMEASMQDINMRNTELTTNITQ